MKTPLLFLLITTACISAQDLSMLLPDSIEGWKAERDPESYTGEDLYKLIDGGADIFREYGFSKCLTGRFIDSSGNPISVEIYEMKDSSAAFGIFSLFTFNTGKRIIFSCDAFAGDGFLLFQKGKYYISLSGNEASETIQKGFIEIAGWMEKNIEPTGKPLLVRKVDELNYSGVAYIKGNLGAYNVSKLPFGTTPRVEEGVCLKIEDALCTILKYNSDENAAASFQNLTGILRGRGTNKIMDSSHSSALFKDDEPKYRHINQYMDFIIITAASDQEKASGITKRIEEFLKR